jgi:hypothetical protein
LAVTREISGTVPAKKGDLANQHGFIAHKNGNLQTCWFNPDLSIKNTDLGGIPDFLQQRYSCNSLITLNFHSKLLIFRIFFLQKDGFAWK